MRRCTALVLSLVLAGCAGSTPPSTSPTATTGIVGGTVEMSGFPPGVVRSILVSVAGTPLNANVSRLGDFVIANIPEGPLELRFTGDGVAATLAAGELAGGETVTLAVRLTAAAAAIESMSRVRGTEALVEGAIERPGVPLPGNTIIVGGRTITIPQGLLVTGAVNGNTGALRAGVRVRVVGTAGPATITARAIIVL